MIYSKAYRYIKYDTIRQESLPWTWKKPTNVSD